MSYADATLDFSAVTVACLAGQNGAGKSALLDAITWALWESARASSDELIRLGEKEMWVDLVFSHEGQCYRVRRSRQKSASKSGNKSTTKGQLEVQVLETDFRQHRTGGSTADNVLAAVANHEASTGSPRVVTLSPEAEDNSASWRSMTSSSMRETQKTLCDLLRMDFDTFVNSAYLRQGRADEFTMRGPTERKHVLAEILGLSYFDKLQERARDKARELKGKAEWLAGSLGVLPQTESRMKDTEGELDFAQKEFEQCAFEADESEGQYRRVNERLQELLLLAQKLESSSDQVEALNTDLGNLAQQEIDVETRLSQLQALLDQRSEIEAAQLEFLQLKDSLESLDHKALLAQDLTGQKLEAQTELAKMRSRTEVDLDHAQTLLRELEGKHSKLLKDTQEKGKIGLSYAQFKQSVVQENELARRQEDFTKLTNRAGELQSLVTEARIRMEADLGQKELALSDWQVVLGGKGTIEEEKALIEHEIEELDKVEAQFELVEEQGLRVKTDLETTNLKIEDLKRRQEEHKEKINELTEHCDSTVCPLCSSPIVDRAAVIARYRKLNEGMDGEISQAHQAIAKFENERNTLRKDYAHLKKRLESRKALDKQIGQFNERLSAVERAEENTTRLTAEVARMKAQLENQDYAQIERESLINIKAEIFKLEFDPVIYSNLQSQIRMQRHIEARHQQLQKDLLELSKVEAEVPRLRERVTTLLGELEGESYGQETRARLHAIKEQIEKIGYDRQMHVELRQKLSTLLPKTELFRDLKRAETEMPALKESAIACAGRIAAKRQQLTTLLADMETWRAATTELPYLNKELETIEPRLLILREQKEELAKMVAVLDAQRKSLAQEIAQLGQKKKELEQTRAEAEDYMFLSDAFGKKGIQAVIIENAIPEIESEANRILSRLTDNKMHVALVTQHKNKSGGTIETLDLLIADDMGTRNYELFSGGEAFKVDFAIRVALSRLLARRSGAKLETLIIDEGFGSQDDISRDRLVKAIRSIQTEFARILVITHISDIKEMFPVHIQVSKVNGSSQLQVVC